MYKILTLALFTSSIFCMNTELRIEDSALMAPLRLGKVSLIHDENGFSVEKEGVRTAIQRAFMPPVLRKINDKQLAILLEKGDGYLKLNQMSDDEYSLDICARGNGGFIGTALGVEIVIRTVGYTAVLGTAGVVIAGSFLVGGPVAAAATIAAITPKVSAAIAVVEVVADGVAATTIIIPVLP